ncbi:MAG: alpha-ketoglutarate-dependent dioxygenase AlkB [Pseudomonadota bacterium]
MAQLFVRGFDIRKAYLDIASQSRMIQALRPVLKTAPLYYPVTPSGRKMSVRMTSAGALGQVTDAAGCRYQTRHPNGTAWPDVPASILDVWRDLICPDHLPDCCAITYYGAGASMSLHQDRDEADFSWPVLSISLGDDALFRIGNATRGGKTEAIWLNSGDVVVMGGPARLTYHGIDRIRQGSSRLLPKGGRLNLTLRVAL